MNLLRTSQRRADVGRPRRIAGNVLRGARGTVPFSLRENWDSPLNWYSSRREGFTLIEMLAVVVIIGILSSLILAAAIRARTVAQQAAVKAEIGQLSLALGAYKEKFGDYPPDITDADAVERHLRKAWPRAGITTIPGTVTSGAGALVFFLAGPDGKGLSADPANPFGTTGSRIPPFFEFDPQRLGTEGSETVYYPDIGSPLSSCGPYVYFRARGSSYDTTAQTYSGSVGGTAKPYQSADGWVNPQSFQIITAGLDNHYGAGGGKFPDGDGYEDQDWDNITNFSTNTLEDEAP